MQKKQIIWKVFEKDTMVTGYDTFWHIQTYFVEQFY